MYIQESIAVFTTPERSDLFRSVIGDGADYRVDPYESVPFDLVMENLKIGGCLVAVCDEEHFFSIEQMASGLADYLNKYSNRGKFVRIIAVCQKRAPGDEWLDYFTAYLGIYDIVYGKDGVGAAIETARLLEHENERVDIVSLLIDHRGRNEKLECEDDEVGLVQERTVAVSNERFDIHVTVSVEPKS